MRLIVTILFLALLTHANAASFYIAKTGNDTTGDGSIGNPWLTIQKGVTTALAGDSVLVATGVYDENVTTARNGTSGSRIIMDGQGVATVKQVYLLHNYIHLQNFTITGVTNPFSRLVYLERGASFCVISNNTIDVASALNVYGFQWNAPSTGPFGDSGVRPAGNVLVISNTITRVDGFTMALVYGDFNVFTRNFFRDSQQADCFNIFGRSNVFSANICSNFPMNTNLANHSDFVQTFGNNGYGSQYIIIESNIVIGVPDGVDSEIALNQLSQVLLPEITDWTFRNNLFINIGIHGSCSVPNVKYHNNTFVRCNFHNGGAVISFASRFFDTGEGWGGLPGTDWPSGGQCINNVFFECGDLTGANTNITGWYTFTTDLTNVIADYNFVCKSGYRGVTPNAMPQRVGDPGGWSLFNWYEDHGINGGNPYVINARNKNFRPFVGSLLINAGTNLSSSFTTDMDGKTRTLPFDIGAYEYVEVPPASLACITEPKASRAFPIANTNFIAIAWPTNQYRLLSMLSRRAYTNNPIYWSSWSSIYSNASNPTREASFVDSNVTAGVHYEYALAQLITNWVCAGVTSGPVWTYQYISTGTDIPLKDNRGNLVLLVESGVASSLATEISNLTNDFIGDGYKVFRHDVASVEVTNAGWATAVTSTRTLVQNDYLTATNADWTLVIVGHVPIPYGGDISPGAHLDNLGAHPSDWYYADRNAANWFDVAVNDSTADDRPQWNVPGDGKFDTNFIPNIPQMRIGRIDLNQFPSTGKTSVQLLSQYLNRNHQWRHKQFTVPEVSTINFSNSYPTEAHGLFSSFYGTTTKTVLTNWLLYLTNNSALFAYSAGTGGYDHDDSLNVPTGTGFTTNILKNPFNGVFVRTFGSYYGDWDTGMRSNLFLPVFLANTGKALTTEYGENDIMMDTSSTGEPIGQQMFAMAANFFASSFDKKYIHTSGLNLIVERVHPYVSLQGDPTLRVRQVAPPTNVTISPSGSDSVVTWTAASDSGIQGYHVYRAPTSDLNDFTRLTSTTTTSPYTNSGAAGGAYTYLVRTVKLEQSDERSYFLASQGEFGTQSGGLVPGTVRASFGSGISSRVTLRGL